VGSVIGFVSSLSAGLVFIFIIAEILSVQQEKSGVKMNYLCTINISCATSMLAAPNKAYILVAMTFFSRKN